MSYTTYISDAIVCGGKPSNTSDKSFLLFTREAGMIYASAKSVREEHSKQRYALQEFSIVRVTLIRGKGGWRIAGAEPHMNVYTIQRTREARALVRNSIRLLRRFLHGESPHTSLYDEVVSALTRVYDGDESVFEEVLAIRVLHMLGYIAPHADLTPIFSTSSLADCIQMLDPKTAPVRRSIIEKALHESQL